IQRIQEILALKPHKLTITLSLDGPPALHDTLRGVTGNWQNCLEVYRHFLSHPHPRLQIFFGFTLSDFNLGAFAATVEAVRKEFPGMNYRSWHMNIAHHSSHYYDNAAIELRSAVNTPAFLQEIAAFREAKRGRWYDPVAFLEGCYLTSALEFIRTKKTPMPCRAIDSSLFLAANGTCYPCSIWDRPLGNIREFNYDLTALLASSEARRAKNEIRAKQCPNCWTPCDAYPTILGNLFKTLS
ncbi:MAG: SPASM domain-containing protein, partial [Magnetococcales bacterium]|nr:SPASM domain-containing protein [Magnetococcales bacterium]